MFLVNCMHALELESDSDASRMRVHVSAEFEPAARLQNGHEREVRNGIVAKSGMQTSGERNSRPPQIYRMNATKTKAARQRRSAVVYPITQSVATQKVRSVYKTHSTAR